MIPFSARRAFIVASFFTALGFGCTAGVPPTVDAVFISTSVPAAADSVFVTSDAWAPLPGSTFELFAVGGASLPTRLTYCSGCQALGASPSLDRTRLILRRALADTNRDGVINDLDRVNMVLVDLARQIEGPFLPDGWSTSSVDWAADGTFLVHTSSPDGGPDDLYTIDANATNNGVLLVSPNIRERGARIDPGISKVVYERIDGVGAGKSEIWVFTSTLNQTRITDSGVTGELLPGTLYLVGSDAGPDYSPDGANVVFRRLTSNAVRGGAWDILTVSGTGGVPTVIASGPQYRSNPDWSKEGIVFAESNLSTGGTDIVVVDPATKARKVLQSFASGFTVGSTRWIAGIGS